MLWYVRAEKQIPTRVRVKVRITVKCEVESGRRGGERNMKMAVLNRRRLMFLRETKRKMEFDSGGEKRRKKSEGDRFGIYRALI